MDNSETNYDDEEKEARKKKKSRHRDEERRNKTKDDDEERKERRREKKSKKAEDGGEGDEEEEERRRRRRKERERLKQLEEQEATGKRDKDDHEKQTNYKRKDSPDDSKHNTEVAALEGLGNSKLTAEPNIERLSLNKPMARPSNNDEDDEANFKIIKPSRRAKAEKEPVIEQKPFVNIWELAIRKMEEKENQIKEEKKEKSILFVGGKSVGKSSIIFRFLERPDEVPKPTVALEYLYAKLLKDNSYERETGHVWELGGGVRLSKIVESVIDENNLWTMRIALVVDLSKPEVMWVTLEKWLEILRKKVEDVVGKMADSRSAKEKLTEKSKQRFREDHQDLEMMDIFPLPLLVIGTKYDVFQGFESEVRKIICKTLRFVCHRNGASLQFCSSKHEGSMSRTRSFISNFLFETPLNPSNQVAHNKELSVVAGMDSFHEIGYPPLAEGDTGRLGAKTPMDLWKYAFNKHFPQEDILHQPVDKDPTKDPQFRDADIDTLKAQKDAELARFLKSMDSKINFEFTLTF